MDIIRLHNPTSPTKMEQGELINDIRSKTWVERYREAGEFTFVGDASSGLRDTLPVGSFVTHVETEELMIVENHEINDEKDQEATITVTGRGYETELEQRIVGSNRVFPGSTGRPDVVLASAYTWLQAKTLIEMYTDVAQLLDDNDAIPYLSIINDVTGTGIQEARTLERKDVYASLLEILAVENLGIKVIRPGVTSPLGSASPNVAWVIHKGVDLSASVMFSNDTGEIESADYLWSNKKLKNTAYVSGKWVETLVTTPATGYDRRMMFVDASDLDQDLEVAPSGAALTAMIASMQQRGIQALAKQKEIALTKAEISKQATKAQYRKDFNVGDLITIHGNYNESSIMRITEYVEIEDETGFNAYPTLSIDS